MEDTIDVTLPISGSVVTIRNYTTKADDIKADAVLYAGVDAKQDMSELSKPSMAFPIANVMASTDVYVYRLTMSIDGDNTNIRTRLESLRSRDYQTVSKAVDKIVGEDSPKVEKAEN